MTFTAEFRRATAKEIEEAKASHKDFRSWRDVAFVTIIIGKSKWTMPSGLCTVANIIEMNRLENEQL